jgi:hypothetical protein
MSNFLPAVMTTQPERQQCVTPSPTLQPRILAASNVPAGHVSEARETMAHSRELDPSLRIANLNEVLFLRRPDDHAKFAERLRKAGLPDFASGRNCAVTCGTINSGLLLY